MIEVNHKGYCFKLQRQIAQDKVEEVTKWMKDCAEKMHQHYIDNMETITKEIMNRLFMEPTGEIYGQSSEDECIHPQLHLIEPKKAAQCLDCGKCYPYDMDMDACGYMFVWPRIYRRKDLLSTDINSELTSTDM